jgi:adenosylmethionine-8-amino-7-oxononanoate aminotransferase
MVFAWDVASSLPDFGRRYARHALDRGLVLRPIGATLYAMPPYVIDEEEGDWLAQGALAALQATLAEEDTGASPVLAGGARDGG